MRKHIGAKPAPAVAENGLRDEHSGEQLNRSHISKPKRRQADRGNPTATSKKTERIWATRRDEPVICAACGRKVQRRMRMQRYCGARCRENDRGRVRKAFLVKILERPRPRLKKAVESTASRPRKRDQAPGFEPMRFYAAAVMI